MKDSSEVNTAVRLIGASDREIYGLPIAEWQRRNWTRAGAGPEVLASIDWVLSTGLAGAVAGSEGAALMEPVEGGERLVAAHIGDAHDAEAVAALIGQATATRDEVAALGLTPDTAVGLAGDYNKALRKRETPFAVDVERDGVLAAEKALFKSSYKGVTDFVTKYAWPVPAFAVTRWCAARKISPNTVTTLSLICVFIAMWFYWHGDWALGIAFSWLMTFLDTVDGKLARTTLTSSKWGDIYDHGIDLIHPPFWYWAWAVGIKATNPEAQWVDAALVVIVAGYVAGRLIEGEFIRRHGFHIHVWERIDSFMREITARRNPNVFIFMVFCGFGAATAGFYAVAIWTVICTAFHMVRLAQAGSGRDGGLTPWIAR